MTRMEKMALINLMGNDSTSVCPKCGSNNCADFDAPYFSMCMDCGFESMASEDPGKAAEAWRYGYNDIEDKARFKGVATFDHDELLDLWWYEVGMDGAADMGMEPQDVDWYWDSHPGELRETVTEMWKCINR